MRLEYLADHVPHLPQLAKWDHAEFGYLNPANTVERYVERLNASLRKSELPTTFVALRDDTLLGSASLVRQTITHQHLSPWLSSVYVDPVHRGGGIASKRHAGRLVIPPDLAHGATLIFETPKVG